MLLQIKNNEQLTCSNQVLFSQCGLWFNSISRFIDKILQRFLSH